MISRQLAACSVLVLSVVGFAPAIGAMQLPKIQSVSFSGSPGNYTATIAGVNFGPVPEGIPCNSCQPLQLQVVDLASQPAQQVINVTDWSDNSITVTGIAIADGDALRIAVYNQTVGNVGAWGGRVSRNKGTPHIGSIVASGSGQSLTLTITGSGFGDAPDVVGQNTNSPYFVFTDYNATAPGTDGFPWNAGFCGANDCNAVTIGYVSWTDTQIVVSGFGSAYDNGSNWEVNPQDAYCVGIWPSSSTSNGTTGGSIKCHKLPK
ncbi:MAG TPA: hypothetical protein VKR31_06245 [Rhizomicrobium sp.]|nr:hypothetical protein [Rhizomicrobium sp.]